MTSVSERLNSLQFMKDWHLVAILFVFVMLEVIILVVVTAIGNARFTVTTIRDKEYPGEFTDVSFEAGILYSCLYTALQFFLG